MVSILIVVIVMSCGLLLSINYAASAIDERRLALLRVDHENYFVKQYDGKEVRALTYRRNNR